MFIEPKLGQRHRLGWIEVISGAMFSGKTEELIRRANRALIANQPVGIFKSSSDTRYSDTHVVSHNANQVPSVPVKEVEEILRRSQEYQVVGIDEAQFFEKGLVQVCIALANQGKRVIVAGLDMDYKGKPFGPMPELMAVSEYVTKLHAICMVCGDPASFTYRKDLPEQEEKVLLGAHDKYEARCRNCFEAGERERT